MDRTDVVFSQILEQEIQKWKKFRRALRLRKGDQEIFDQLFEKARLYGEAGRISFKAVPLKQS